ncbi:glycosyltransferase [Hansschlegelia plantiphila]|uniref:Glycosyl transferase n=1 Tax=Hansschlegelia plantiphila TaxID=374655 RepID=A0A9W6IZ92_9HYPH|nr:glycosyltransferase [Hansschlegelia plantiphila]GLK67772.1 glycosyl transferase [Hansschlegelia plantiphila]
MLSVVIPTRNHERSLVTTLAALVPGAADGVVRDVTIADGGSTDATLEVADLAGCNALKGGLARGDRLDAAARRAKGPWLLFLDPDVTLEEGWHREVRSLIDALERTGEADRRAAVFGYGVDGFGGRDRLAERLAGLAGLLTGLPRPEQGLLIHKSFYERLGGFRPLPAMADADLIRRIGRGRIVRLRARALAPAPRAEAWRAGPKAALGAGLLMLRVPPRLVARLYG